MDKEEAMLVKPPVTIGQHINQTPGYTGYIPKVNDSVLPF